MGEILSSRAHGGAERAEGRLERSTYIVILLIAALPRTWALFDDFWLDEIWSWSFARGAASPLEPFVGLKHDNNHPLNTFFLVMLGDRPSWFVYRLPSLFAGLGTVALAMRIGGRRGRIEAGAAGLLFALSYPMVVYSTEARGYATAVFFSLLAFDLMHSELERPRRWRRGVLFGVIVLGMASHLSFVHVYGALAAWSAWSLARRGENRRQAARVWMELHVPALALICAIYFLRVRPMIIGGGSEWSLEHIAGETAALALGAPLGPAGMVAGALGAGTVLAGGMIVLWRERSDQWIFYGLGVVVFPGLSLWLFSSGPLFARYFLVSIAIFLLLLAHLPAHLVRLGRGWGLTGAVAFALIGVGHVTHIVAFLAQGRGHYSEAVAYMAEHTQGEQISVASDHDFRNRLVLGFYERYLEPGKAIVYHERASWPLVEPEWFLTHSQERRPTAPAVVTLGSGRDYTLERRFPYYGPSGWHWFLYRRAEQ